MGGDINCRSVDCFHSRQEWLRPTACQTEVGLRRGIPAVEQDLGAFTVPRNQLIGLQGRCTGGVLEGSQRLLPDARGCSNTV